MTCADRDRRFWGLLAGPVAWHSAWCGLILLSTALCYGQVRHAEFVKWDDLNYVISNLHVHAGLTWDTLRWAFTTTEECNYHPLTWLSHALDWQLFGGWAGGHHVVNVGLHMTNALLVYAVLCRMTGAAHRSGMVAVLFALHPLHVESVAWVSERKDVLSTCLALFSLHAYVSFVNHRRAAGTQCDAGRASWRYGLMILLFAAGLLCKPMLVSLPFLMLLLDFWPLCRWPGPVWPLLREKLPLFALSAASCVATFYAQYNGGATAVVQHLGFIGRLANAAVAYSFYLNKTFLPTGLAFMYPHPGTWPAGKVALSMLLLAAISAAVARCARTRPHLVVGWLWFLGLLVPVIGIVQVGGQAYADRYTYLPLCGIFIMGAWSIPGPGPGPGLGPGSRRYALVCIGVGAAVLLGLGLLTHAQVGTWRNSRALFTRGIAVVPDNAGAYNWLGVDAVDHGELKAAESYFKRALALGIDGGDRDVWSHYNLANVLIRLERDDEAIPYLVWGIPRPELEKNDVYLKDALHARPAAARADFYRQLAAALEGQGKDRDALRYSRLAP